MEAHRARVMSTVNFVHPNEASSIEQHIKGGHQELYVPQISLPRPPCEEYCTLPALTSLMATRVMITGHVALSTGMNAHDLSLALLPCIYCTYAMSHDVCSSWSCFLTSTTSIAYRRQAQPKLSIHTDRRSLTGLAAQLPAPTLEAALSHP